MPGTQSAAQGKQETPWGIGFTSLATDMFTAVGGTLRVSRAARPGEVLDPHAFDGLEGEPFIVLALPGRAQRTLILEKVEIAEDRRSFTVIFRPRENDPDRSAVAERERAVHEDPALAAQIRDGIAEAEAGLTVYRGSFAEHLEHDDDE